MKTTSELLEQKKNLFIVGLMGGIASGKSTVGKMFQKLGSELVEADKIAHRILEYKVVKKNIVDIWGESLLVEDKIDRKALGKIVFNQSTELTRLEKIIHPVLRKRIFQKLKHLSQKNKKIVVLDIALLWENGLKEICDILVFVDTPLSVRKKRASNNRNWKESEVPIREQFQESIDVKKKAAHFVIQNKGDISQTWENVNNLWKIIVEKSKEYGLCS